MKLKIFIAFYLFVITHVIPCYGMNEHEQEKGLSLQNPSTLRSNSTEGPIPTPVFGPRVSSFDGIPYSPQAHHQDTVNSMAIRDFAEAIKTWYHENGMKPNDGSPIDMLDIGCGPGKPTYDLLRALTENSILVNQITGEDISRYQIAEAVKTYENEPRLRFNVQNMEEMSDKNQYDVIVSFFALHWANDINAMAKLIRDAIKPNGKLMFLVPLGDDPLFKYRQRFRKESHWQHHLSDFNLVNFHTDEGVYKNAFDPHFMTDGSYTKVIDRTFNYTREEFSTFLSSWLPEKRYLNNKDIDSSTYATELVDFIVSALYTQGDPDIDSSLKLRDGKIVFTGLFFQYSGTASSPDL